MSEPLAVISVIEVLLSVKLSALVPDRLIVSAPVAAVPLLVIVIVFASGATEYSASLLPKSTVPLLSREISAAFGT